MSGNEEQETEETAMEGEQQRNNNRRNGNRYRFLNKYLKTKTMPHFLKIYLKKILTGNYFKL